jgi:mannose-6-phosphate isomerase-like protein (cupin superfamily)
MRIRPVSFLMIWATLPLVAADPPGFVYWPGGVPPANGPKGAKFDNHGLGITSRDHDGLAEVHENQTDIVVVQKGEATLVAGGELVDSKTIRPGELQGSAIKDGIRKNLSAGDIIHIPAGMPHQFLLEGGKQITYFVVKVNKP